MGVALTREYNAAMKLPRWLVILMLTTSVLSVLAAAGWWWVTWPERTAQEFVALMMAGKEGDAKRMIQYSPQPVVLWGWFHSQRRPLDWNHSDVHSLSRTISDIVTARQKFLLPELHITVRQSSIESARADYEYFGPPLSFVPVSPNAWRDLLLNPPQPIEDMPIESEDN